MKKFNLLVILIAAICFASCNNATLTPDSTEINGPLGEYFEIVNHDYKVNDGTISIEFKRIAEGGPTDLQGTDIPTFFVELIDDDGNTISSKSSMDEITLVGAVVALGVGQSASIPFKFETTDGATEFKVSSNWTGESTTKGADSSDDEYEWLSERQINSDDVEGMSKDELRILRNFIFARHGYIFKSADLAEYFSKFEWYTPRSHDVYNELSSIERQNVDQIKIYEQSGTSSSSYNDYSYSDPHDWDAFLDAYENYVDQYISYMKKAAKGDMTALAEYPSLMEKAQEYCDQAAGAQGTMTSAQWSRYLKITNKMVQAAQNMR